MTKLAVYRTAPQRPSRTPGNHRPPNTHSQSNQSKQPPDAQWMFRRSFRRFSTYYTARNEQGSFRIDTFRAPQFVGHASSRSMMKYNEDRYSLGFLDLRVSNAVQPVFNAAVFDGHGGPQYAQFLSQRLSHYVEEADVPRLKRTLGAEYRRQFGGYWRKSRIPKASSPAEDDLATRLPLAFLQADLDGMALDKMSGSTCTSAYIYPLDPAATYWTPGVEANIVVAQVGDTRAIISDSSGNSLRLTTVHHANSAHESDRLARYAHAFVTTPAGTKRFMQYINTRAFGDHQGKHWGISAEPDLTQYFLGNHRGRLPGHEAFMVLVSDGVTDKASDQEICDLVIQQAMKGGSLRGTPQDAANEVVSYVQMLGTSDNATALVVRLGGWGEWSNWRDRSGGLRVEKLKSTLRRQ